MLRNHPINQMGRRKGKAPFVHILHSLIASRAYRSLSPAARALYVEFVYRHNGANNGNINMSVRDAADQLGCAPNSARQYLAELQDRGFICVSVKGTIHVKIRHATSWRLTALPCNENPPTREYQKWQPPDKAKPGSNS